MPLQSVKTGFYERTWGVAVDPSTEMVWANGEDGTRAKGFGAEGGDEGEEDSEEDESKTWVGVVGRWG